MCGICGVFSTGRPDDALDDVIVRMRDTMQHRGPDDAGVYISPERAVALGHRRLSIIDLSAAGHQPMTNEDGSLWIVFNGEVYNHVELRNELEARGHQFRSRTDTETLLHLYEEVGPAMLSRLRGMFAFAIWDTRRRELFLARDRIGIKPLYYTFAGGRVVFASEIKAILAHPAITRDLDVEAMYHYLTFLAAPAPSTMFRGISKLPPGHYLLVRADGSAQTTRWWDLADAPALDPELLASDAACATHLRGLLTESVRIRLMADVPLGILLSGGLDSSSITALVRQLHNGPVHTFSVGYSNDPAYSELPKARAVAQALGTEHHEVVLDHADAVAYIPELVHAQDEPLADWTCVPLYYVSKLVRDAGTIVALVGEGSDEQLLGYDHYLRYIRLQRGAWGAYQLLPRWLRGAIHTLADPVLRRSSLPREIRDLFRRAARNEPLFLSGAVAAWESDKRDLLTAAAWPADGTTSPDLVMAVERGLRRKRPDISFVDALIYQEFQLRLPELLLMRVDKITMSTSIEARVPFLDHQLVEFTSRIPWQMKVRGMRSKHLLKESVRDLLPADVINRKKQGFSTPIKEWLRGPLYGYARHTLLTSRLRERGLLDYDALANMLEAHRSGARNYDMLLWAALNLSQWYDTWIAGDAGSRSRPGYRASAANVTASRMGSVAAPRATIQGRR